MSDASVLPRRRLLGLICTAGIAGFTVGAGSLARVRDTEHLTGRIGTSEFDVELAAGTGTDSPRDFSDGGTAALRFADLSVGDSGRAVVAVRSVTSRASATLDLRLDGGADSPLLEVLQTTFTVRTRAGGIVTPHSGTLGGLIEALDDGYDLRRCVAAEPTEIGVTWSLPADAPAAVYGETVAMTLRVSGSSCTRQAGGDGSR